MGVVVDEPIALGLIDRIEVPGIHRRPEPVDLYQQAGLIQVEVFRLTPADLTRGVLHFDPDPVQAIRVGAERELPGVRIYRKRFPGSSIFALDCEFKTIGLVTTDVILCESGDVEPARFENGSLFTGTKGGQEIDCRRRRVDMAVKQAK